MLGKRGITVTNYLVTSDPEGIILAYLSNWTGQAIKIPRNLFVASKDMLELNRPGIYLLIGQNIENPDDKLIYVGEANILSERVVQHLKDADKSFAETIVCFSSKDENLTVSHTKYLEQKIISKLGKSSEFRLINKKEGSLVNLPRMVQDEMDTYFDYMKIVLPTLGYSVLHNKISNIAVDILDKKLTLEVAKIKATGKLTSNGLEVLNGSEMNKLALPSLSGSYSNLRETLVQKNIVEDKGDKFVFTSDYEFSSSSTAAAIILGYSVNGRAVWKYQSGKSIKDMEDEQIQPHNLKI